jgi:rhamnosyl/mannosyltransferase
VPAIVAASPNYLDTSEVLRSFAPKCHCIPYGLPDVGAPSPALLEKWRGRLPERFFLYVGVFRYYKGLDYLLTAAKDLPCQIALVGRGPLEMRLKDRAAGEGLTNVHFLGALLDEDKEALLSLCSGVILPSHLRSEAFGISLLEGARRGKPLICCDIGTGTSYINLHGQTGLVVPPADPAALRSAMLTLWEDYNLAEKMGEGAMSRFKQLFTSSQMIFKYISLYRSFITK